MDLSLYIHIPFCRAKCLYCDFNSSVYEKAVMEEYIGALYKEVALLSSLIKDYRVKTLFVGGGTPSILKLKDIEHIYIGLKRYINIDPLPEFSIEVNPDTVTEEFISGLKEMGINRVSIGIQSWDDSVLNKAGRLHSASDAHRAVETVLGSGIKNINMDLIFGFPGQTLKLWQESIKKTLKYNPHHISVYNLMVEEGSVYNKWLQEGRLSLPSEESQVNMYKEAKRMLISEGFNNYEISNYALKGFECKHNLTCWNHNEYVGIGLGAHSYLKRKRYYNTDNINEYILKINKGQLPVKGSESISEERELSDTMILGLRLCKGIDYELLGLLFDKRLIEKYLLRLNKYVNHKLIEKKGGRYFLSEEGIILSDTIFADLI